MPIDNQPNRSLDSIIKELSELAHTLNISVTTATNRSTDFLDVIGDRHFFEMARTDYIYPSSFNEIFIDDVPDIDMDLVRSKKKKINYTFFKSNPTWNKLFLLMANRNSFLIELDEWNDLVNLIKNNLNIIKGKVNVYKYINSAKKSMFIGKEFLENISNDIHKIITTHKAKSFILKNFKSKFPHLIDKKVKNIIFQFFHNKLDEKHLKSQITSFYILT